MSDVSFYPKYLWNLFWSFGGLNPISWVGTFFWYAFNLIYAYTLYYPVTIWNFLVYTVRTLTGWTNAESFVVACTVGGLATWFFFETDMGKEMFPPMEEGAEGAAM